MDIDLLSKMVKELILDNDKVVLPGLGAFVAEIVPSTFSDKGYTINPPYRRLYFRSKPNEGDALIDFYMSANNLSREVAEKVICEFVEELKSVLHAKKTVIFPGLGRLRATKENTIFFVADEDLDIYPDGFGLESISLKAHQETAEEVSAVVAELRTMVEPVVEEVVVSESEIEVMVDEEPSVDEEPTADDVMVEDIPVIDEIPVVDLQQKVAAEQAESEVAPGENEPVAVETDKEEPVMENKRLMKTWLKAVLICAAVVVVLLAAFTIVARVSPNIFDHILYSAEELEILNR